MADQASRLAAGRGIFGGAAKFLWHRRCRFHLGGLKMYARVSQAPEIPCDEWLLKTAPAPLSPGWREQRHLDRSSRYLVAIGALAAALLFRYLVRDSLGFEVPYLQFYPAIIVAAWYGGLGPGVATTVLATMAAMYFFLPPAGFAVGDASDQLSLGVFVATGLVISWLNHRLHLTEAAHRTAAATATARAEQLDAILNTTTDGIIVINAKGIIEAFNRGAEQLFGYPESEVIGRNVSLLMPSPHHEAHDQYLERYLATGEAKIIGVGREVPGRRRDGTRVSGPLVRRRNADWRRAQVYGHVARPDEACTPRRGARSQRSTVARDRRLRR